MKGKFNPKDRLHRSCLSKRLFATEEAVKKSIAETRALRDPHMSQDYEPPIYYYKCDFGDHYHKTKVNPEFYKQLEVKPGQKQIWADELERRAAITGCWRAKWSKTVWQRFANSVNDFFNHDPEEQDEEPDNDAQTAPQQDR
jgi:hypothetical protein